METFARFSRWAVAIAAIAGLYDSPTAAQAQDAGYHDESALGSALSDLGRMGRVISVTEIARSPGGRPVHSIRLGAGNDVDTRPAVLVVAGAWGPHVVGSEIALRTAQRLASGYGADSALTALLDRRTIYVIPVANPDAASGFFDSPRRERTRNDKPYDDDRDGYTDEDGPNDLNADGLITAMRVADPAGDWIADPDEPRLMREAKRTKGEVGAYRLYTEGFDDDADESWNEDPVGGVDVNRNLPYAYEFFGEATGLHPVSSPEARAIASFFTEHPNVAAVYALGPQDNLIEPWKHEPGSDRSGAGNGADGNDGRTERAAPTSVLEEDSDWFGRVADRFQEETGWDAGSKTAAAAGDVVSFSYYHMGRWSFGSRGWWIPAIDDAADGDSAAVEDEGTEKDKDDPLKQERIALAWIDANQPGGFVEWTPIEHPDFPGRTVEIGGFAPHVQINPPATELDSLAALHTAFVARLVGMLPAIRLDGIEVERVGDGVYRLTARVANDGYLPSVSAMGARARWPRRIKVELITDGQTLSGGRAIQLLDPIPGSGGSVELTWLLIGTQGSSVTLRAASPVAGYAEQTIALR